MSSPLSQSVSQTISQTSEQDRTAAGAPAMQARPKVPDSRDYHAERRRYLARARKNAVLQQHYLARLVVYLLRRCAWSFGFFPVVLAAWLPLVLAGFNPVVMVQQLIPHLQAFVSSNPEVQARTLDNLMVGWISIGLFFLLFDIIITPFRSPIQQEADIHMRAWSQSQGIVPPDEV